MPVCSRDSCSQFANSCLWEFHYSKFCPCHKSWRVFTFTPWLPYSWKFQWIYLIYRWILVIYFFITLFFVGFDERFGGTKFPIYLTHWVFVLWTLYIIWAAIFVTVTYFRVFLCQKDKFAEGDIGGPCNHELLIDDCPVGCCGVGNDKAFWYQKIHWVLYTISIHLSILVVILYWGLLYIPDIDFDYFSYVSISTHILSGTFAVVDIYVTSIPTRILHVIYPFTCGAVYVVFSAIYYAAGGTNHFGSPYIYSILDYDGNPSGAVTVIFITLFLAVPFIHIGIFVMFLVREAFLYNVKKYCCKYIAGGDNYEILEEPTTIELKAIP